MTAGYGWCYACGLFRTLPKKELIAVCPPAPRLCLPGTHAGRDGTTQRFNDWKSLRKDRLCEGLYLRSNIEHGAVRSYGLPSLWVAMYLQRKVQPPSCRWSCRSPVACGERICVGVGIRMEEELGLTRHCNLVCMARSFFMFI